MAFNVLLVFLPVAGIVYLGSYETKLLNAQTRGLGEQARLLAAAVSAGGNPEAIVEAQRQQALTRGEPIRLRIVAQDGAVMADTRTAGPAVPLSNRARRNVLYRAGAMLLKPLLGLFRANEPALTAADLYERSERLLGDEVQTALAGTSGRVERITPDQRSVTVYIAEPIRRGGEIIGAAIASQSTFTILQDLYTVRLGIVRIFAISILVAVILSLLVATTIVRPLRQLRLEAGGMLDRQGRLRGHFRGSRKHDEIGDLSRTLERLTSRLDEHVRFIESFAADVSHEFKNPLASIRTAAEMLAEVEEPAQRKRFHRMVEQDIARMESLLSGVREITVIDAQLQTEQRLPIDVCVLLGRIVDGFRLREKDRVTINLDAPPSGCVVYASEDRLIQVLVNVLENAVSFSPAGGVVSIAAQQSTGKIVISIADQGPGIPPSNLPRVFDRFFTHRPETARSRTAHTGLGLAIVKAIVEGYGGTIGVENGAGGGAKFEIRLPM